MSSFPSITVEVRVPSSQNTCLYFPFVGSGDDRGQDSAQAVQN